MNSPTDPKESATGEPTESASERRPHLEVRLKLDETGKRTGSTSESEKKPAEGTDGKDEAGRKPVSGLHKMAMELGSYLSTNLQWIPQNCTWSKWKVTLRCALTAWVCGVIFIIPQSENAIGQASFLILIASFLSPPSDPFMAVLERELLIVLFACLAWAWGCLGIKLADLTRTVRDPTASLAAVFSGQYIEAAPSVIMAIFIFFGSAFFLYIKARQGPGPFVFACVFGCICLDITLTTSALFPYPYYVVGKAIVTPLALHSAVALIMSVLVFPSSISALFTARMQGVYGPLTESLVMHRNLLRTPTDSTKFSQKPITAAVNQAESSLVALAAAARLLKVDIIYGRYSPKDFKTLHDITRRLVVRANGMTVYFELIDPTRERFPVTPIVSRMQTPAETTPNVSRPPSPTHSPNGSSGTRTPQSTGLNRDRGLSTRRRHPQLHYADSRSHPHQPVKSVHYGKSQSHHSHHNLLHSSLLHLALSRNPKSEEAVGVFESNRYHDLESTRFSDPDSAHLSAQTTRLLDESADELLESCALVLMGIQEWLGLVRTGRWDIWTTGEDRLKRRKDRMEKYEQMKIKHEDVLERFRYDKRFLVLEPWMKAFDPVHKSPDGEETDLPPHRYLFHCYVYQFHLLQFGRLLVEAFNDILRLEKERTRNKLWLPVEPLRKLLSWGPWEPSENLEKYDDEDPDIIQGVEPQWLDDLGMARRRDPDALPPRNGFEAVMNYFFKIIVAMRGGNTLFAIKAGILSVLLSIPSFLKSSGSFAYEHKFIWAIFMGQLTIARYRGDTTFGLVARTVSTFLGGATGLVMWYISTGSGLGNPYGLAAVLALCFPFFFFARLYFPGPPMTNIIFFVTTALVVGYSYQDTHLVLPSSPGWGFSVAWRRFTLVVVGVFAAFIFSFFPPSTTIRCYQRTSLATSAEELGVIYCSIISFANSPDRSDLDVLHIIQSLTAIRSKLKRSLVLRTNVIYEFSLRGKWPVDRYHKILEIQLQAAFLLSHLMSVIERLDPAWSLAFLRRTRMLDPDFQGDVLAVVTMIHNSLRSGMPLPQVTPCPLVDRFMARHHGLNVIHQESTDDYGLPRTLTMNTLKNEQYLIFSVGVSTAFAVVTRIDRLMIAVKELVGEQYHITGLGINRSAGGDISQTIPMIPPV